MAGQLATASFDHQHPQAPDNRMQRPNLNARNEISPWIRWEGMQVYVVQEQKTYQLVGGTGNEHWQEIAAGGGASNFVGQFPTFDDLPNSGSPGDYAYVGTGDDFVQYNWDQIAGEWRLNSAETKVSDEDFFLGRVPSEPDRVMFSMRRNSIIYSTGGAQSISPDRMANYVFTGENVTLENVNYDTEGNEEFHITNRTGSNLTILGTGNFASGLTIPAGHMASFKSSNDGWVQSFVNEEATFSDTLDSINARISRGPDGKDVLSGIFDRNTGRSINFKQIPEPDIVDGILNVMYKGDFFRRSFSEVHLEDFGVLPENSAELNAANFAYSQQVIMPNSRVVLATGEYEMDDVEIIKDGVYDFSGVTFKNNMEVEGSAVLVSDNVDFAHVIGLNLKYEGEFYTASNGHAGGYGPQKDGIYVNAKKAIISNCRVSSFSRTGIMASNINNGLYVQSCICNNNGYAGVYSEGADMQVIGGEYNYNGGSNDRGNGYGDGYGIVGNVALNGNFKAIGTTVIGNRTRGIDSHTGQEIIITSNFVADSGQPNPQWFNVAFDEALNIRLTQRIKKAIVSSNISKNATLAGISVDTILRSGEYLREAIISSNMLEDNRYQIYIRPDRTESLIISDNVTTVSAEYSPPVDQTSILINPFSDPEGRGFIKKLNINGNIFNNARINLTGTSESSGMVMSDNTFIDAEVNLGSSLGSIVVSSNKHKSFTLSGTNGDSTLSYIGNTQDKENGDGNFYFSSFLGKTTFSHNNLLNSNASTLMVIPPNMSFCDNSFIGCNNLGTVGTVIRGFDCTNSKILDNYINCDNPPTYALRVQLSPNMIVRGNRSTSGGLFRTEYIRSTDSAAVGVSSDRLVIDYEYYDIGLNDFPTIDYVFADGAKMVRSNPMPGQNEGWVMYQEEWVPYGGLIKESKDISNTNYSYSQDDSRFYIRFTGTDGLINILDDRFFSGDELQGEIEGGAKTFVAGAGVTLRYPAGGTNVAPTDSRFFIKFKSPNDAQLTIVPSTTPENTYDTFIPAINGSTANPTASYTEQFGDYALIDKLCHFELRLNWQSMSGGTGLIRIPLPIPRLRNTANGGPSIAVMTGLSTATPIYACYSGFNNIGFRNAAGNEISVSDLESEGVIALSGTYIIGG